jgi:hypothetical protein
MQGMYVGSDGKEIGISRRRGRWQRCGYVDSINKERSRGPWRQTSTGEVRAMQQWHHDRYDEGEVKWLGEGACQ